VSCPPPGNRIPISMGRRINLTRGDHPTAAQGGKSQTERDQTRGTHMAAKCVGETPTRGPSGQWRPARWGGGTAQTCQAGPRHGGFSPPAFTAIFFFFIFFFYSIFNSNSSLSLTDLNAQAIKSRHDAKFILINLC
jgi:hypothetical protein